MKIMSLEIIFWFPLKSFSSFKCILLSVLTAFVLCFKGNHKGYVASTCFSPGNYFILCNEKCYTLPTSGLCLPLQNMVLVDNFFFLSFFWLSHSLNLCFSRDAVLQILFLFCTCCFRLVKCSWIMLGDFHNFVV